MLAESLLLAAFNHVDELVMGIAAYRVNITYLDAIDYE